MSSRFIRKQKNIETLTHFCPNFPLSISRLQFCATFFSLIKFHLIRTRTPRDVSNYLLNISSIEDTREYVVCAFGCATNFKLLSATACFHSVFRDTLYLSFYNTLISVSLLKATCNLYLFVYQNLAETNESHRFVSPHFI